MAEVKKQLGGPEEGKANAEVIAQFENTTEDENGNLIASGRQDGPEGFRENATVVKRYGDTVEGEDGHLHAVDPEPDFAK